MLDCSSFKCSSAFVHTTLLQIRMKDLVVAVILLNICSLNSLLPCMQALKGFAAAETVEVWLVVPVQILSCYKKIPLAEGAWPEGIESKRVICKIGGLTL